MFRFRRPLLFAGLLVFLSAIPVLGFIFTAVVILVLALFFLGWLNQTVLSSVSKVPKNDPVRVRRYAHFEIPLVIVMILVSISATWAEKKSEEREIQENREREAALAAEREAEALAKSRENARLSDSFQQELPGFRDRVEAAISKLPDDLLGARSDLRKIRHDLRPFYTLDPRPAELNILWRKTQRALTDVEGYENFQRSYAEASDAVDRGERLSKWAWEEAERSYRLALTHLEIFENNPESPYAHGLDVASLKSRISEGRAQIRGNLDVPINRNSATRPENRPPPVMVRPSVRSGSRRSRSGSGSRGRGK